jgi:transcriptional regulator with XRE-family HTH domain
VHIIRWRLEIEQAVCRAITPAGGEARPPNDRTVRTRGVQASDKRQSADRGQVSIGDDDRPMSGRDRRVDAGTRVARRALGRLGHDLRVARRAAGVSQATLGEAIGCSHAQVSRIELGRHDRVALEDLARAASVLGLRLAIQLYPTGPPLRDLAHVRLLGRLRDRLGPSLGWQTEVGLPLPGDLRAWDAVVSVGPVRVAVEAETRLEDLQAVVRRVELKRRDDPVDVIVLLVNRTAFNVAVVRASASVLGEAFPWSPRLALADLAAGRAPSRSVLLLL